MNIYSSILQNISFLKANVTSLHLHHHPPTFKTKPHTSKHQSETFSLIHNNGCCVTRSDKSGARPSLWQHLSLLQLLIQQPTMGKTRLFFQVRTSGTNRKSAHNVNRDHMSLSGSLNSQNHRALETTGKACKYNLFINVNLDTTCIGDKRRKSSSVQVML